MLVQTALVADRGVNRLGLTRGEVELVPSDPSWPYAFERLAGRIREACGPLAVAIEHVGSTAVPALRAKPIIDIALGLSIDAGVDDLVAVLSPLGFIFRGDHGEDGGLLFVLDDAREHRIAHVHAVAYGGKQWSLYIALRDRLRADAATRIAYENVKDKLAQEFPHDRQAYTAGKDAFLAALLTSIADSESQPARQASARNAGGAQTTAP
jgi:GrpB-like predicted nucleotidyltransferase (UPF0157 family)